MRTSIYLIIPFMLFTNSLIAQKNSIDRYLLLKPSEIKASKSGIQKYDVSLKWQNLEAISGNKMNCNAAKATYIAGLENDSVSWENVSLAQINDFQQKDYIGTNLPSFNDFTYKVNKTNFLKDDFYKTIPPDQRDLAKWLVSDAIQMQGLAWYVFDSLTYNKPFAPKLLNNYDVKFENWVTFTNRYQKLIWSGISKHNNEICAIVKFESYHNPLKIDNKQMQINGRSLYFGEIWISMKDKQVEYASMFEDVIMKFKSPVFPDEQLVDLQREIIFNKRK